MREIIKICLVGDKLINFRKNHNVMIFSEFIKYLKEISNLRIKNQNLIVVIGQGISDRNISLIEKIVSDLSLEDYVDIRKPFNKNTRSNNDLVHKRRIENNMISTPELIGKEMYQSYLMLDDQCDEMNDHLTGQHLQGMILIESARQMTLAVTEKFYIKEINKENVAFITNSLYTNFIGYVFPCGVQMIYKILENRKGNDLNAKYKVLIQFLQNEEIKTEVIYEFSTMEKKFLYEKEEAMAKKSIETYLEKNAMAA